MMVYSFLRETPTEKHVLRSVGIFYLISSRVVDGVFAYILDHAYLQCCIHACTSWCIHAYIRYCIHAYIRCCIHAYMLDDAFIHAYIFVNVFMHILHGAFLHVFTGLTADAADQDTRQQASSWRPIKLNLFKLNFLEFILLKSNGPRGERHSGRFLD